VARGATTTPKRKRKRKGPTRGRFGFGFFFLFIFVVVTPFPFSNTINHSEQDTGDNTHRRPATANARKTQIPWTPPQATGNKAVDRANLRAFATYYVIYVL